MKRTGGGPLEVEDVSSTVTVLDCIGVGGARGPGGTSPCGNAANGQMGSGAFFGSVLIAGSHRTLTRIAPAREGQNLMLHFEGQPGDRVFLANSARASQTFDALMHGALLVRPPFRRFLLGTIDGSGVLDALLPVSEIGAGVEGLGRYAQGILVDVQGERWVTGCSPVVMLDSSL